MSLPSIVQTARSGMIAAKVGIATTGHNVANANTEGYTRQRLQQTTTEPQFVGGSHAMAGSGVAISRIERLNDTYVEKQIRNASRDMSHLEEKDLVFKQVEDIFNEMGGEGLNRMMGKFFNDFRKLANEPDNEALRQSVRESSQSMINDFHRIRSEVDNVRKHIDARIEGQVSEVNALATEIRDQNVRIKALEVGGANPNDLLDKRDVALKKLGSYMDLSMHQDNEGAYIVDIKGIGPLVTAGSCEKFLVERTPDDGRGKPDNSLDIKTTASVQGVVTHSLKGGKLGALVEARDTTLSTVLDRMDELAYKLTSAVNDIHQQGYNKDGVQGVDFFKPMTEKKRAAEFIELSDAVANNVNNIATAALPDSPGDNRIALAISGLQYQKIADGNRTTVDDFYNSIVSDVGVVSSRNRSGMAQQKDIQNQLNKMREQLSGVSIDEETTNLLQYQHAFDASAKVIQVADELLKTVLDLKR